MSTKIKCDQNKMEFEQYRTVCPVPEMELLKIKNRILEQKLLALTADFLALKKEVDFIKKNISCDEKDDRDSWKNDRFPFKEMNVENMKKQLSHSAYTITEETTENGLEIRGRLIDKKYNVYTITGLFSNVKEGRLEKLTFSTVLDLVHFSYKQNETYFSLHNRMASMPFGIKFGDTFDEVSRKGGFQNYERKKEIRVFFDEYEYHFRFHQNVLCAYTIYNHKNKK